MSSEENPGKMVSSSETRSSLDAKDHDDLFDKVGDDDGTVRLISEEEEEESLERNLAEDNKQMADAEDDSDNLKDEEAATPVNPLSGNAAQILPLLQNLLLQNEIQRERLIGLIQLYDPTAAEGRNAIVNAEGEQIATETDLSSEVHFLEQSVEKLEEELENQKKANAQLEDQIKRLTKSSDP